MVWVHGGGFLVGSTFEYGYEGFANGLVSNDVIVVSINYRVGPWGFFSTGDDVCAGKKNKE